MQQVPAGFYDGEYFTAGTKSNYQPYGPGDWAPALTRMIVRHLAPESVLDVGCATGIMVDLLSRHCLASGFDISQWAVSHSVSGGIWQGSVENAATWRKADLILCTEVAEHLTDTQASALMRNAFGFGNRMLMLIATHHEDGDVDASHINFHPIEWWASLAESYGWRFGDASMFNEDPHSRKMAWSGRFMLLAK